MSDLRLTKEQKKAISLMPDHNVQIIACAGSGKTEIISRGAMEILRRGVSPSKIVAFTFTEKAADSLKKRIRQKADELEGVTGDIGEMYIGTIHSYCFETLRNLDPEYQAYDVLDDASRVAFVSKPYTYWNQLDLQRLESRGKSADLKRYTVINRFINTVDLYLNEKITRTSLKKSDPELLECIDGYLELLREDHYFDFSTMVYELVSRLENDRKLLQALRSNVKHVIVDEYQDINGLQERLIKAMVGPKTRITVVGDDDQSIYGWRGAVVDYIINFEKNFSNVVPVRLEKNFRSTKGLISLSNRYIEQNSNRLEKSMLPSTRKRSLHEPQDIQYRHFPDQAAQLNFITSRIEELTGSDFLDRQDKPYALSYGDMAILLRSNTDIRSLLPMLDAANVPYVVDSGEIIFEKPVVICAFDLLDYVFSSTGNELKPLISQYTSFLGNNGYKKISPSFINREVAKIRADLDRIAWKDRKDYLGDLGLQGIFHRLLKAMGIDQFHLSDPDHYYLATMSKAISDYEKVWQRLRHKEYKYFRGFIMAWGQHQYAVAESNNLADIDAVKVMTIHKAKGLEFPVVFLPYLNKKRKNSFLNLFMDESLFDSDRYRGNEEDERRVYYVAMTRAEKYLFLSGMEHDPVVKSLRKPADFVDELDRSALKAPADLKLTRSGLKPRREFTYDFTTSFSELVAYGRCGYDYKLRYVYGYNAGVPVAFGYGTQIHNILNIIHQNYRDADISDKEVLRLVEDNFFLRYAPGNMKLSMQKAAERVVLNYVHDHRHEFGNVLETEKSFEFALDDTLMAGQIDLIKKTDSKGKLQEIEVVDFKSDNALLYKLDNEHQIRLYVMACVQALGLDPQRACIHDLDTGEKKYVDIDRASLKTTENELRRRIHGVRNEVYKPIKDKKICGECDYGMICSQQVQ